jgi:hypothetical protein
VAEFGEYGRKVPEVFEGDVAKSDRVRHEGYFIYLALCRTGSWALPGAQLGRE